MVQFQWHSSGTEKRVTVVSSALVLIIVPFLSIKVNFLGNVGLGTKRTLECTLELIFIFILTKKKKKESACHRFLGVPV